MYSNTFSLMRVIKSITTDFNLNRRKIALTIITTFVFTLFLNIAVLTLWALPTGVYHVVYFGILFGGGMFLTSTLNERAGHIKSGLFFQISPMTKLEKFSSRYLLTGPLYFVVFQIFYSLFCFLSSKLLLISVKPIKLGDNPFFDTPFLGDFSLIGPFLVCHAVYLCISQLFRKNNFIYATSLLLLFFITMITTDMLHRYIMVSDSGIAWGVGNSFYDALGFIYMPSRLIWLNQVYAYAFIFPSMLYIKNILKGKRRKK